MSLMMDGTFWVFVGLVIFLGLALKAGAHKAIGAALDKRSDEISKELDQARQLREEAQQLLASYQRKQRDAEKEAQDIIELAEAEAERLAAETREALQVSLERRTKMAEDKITQAEIRAVQEVRDIAANVAISAAEKIIAEKLAGDKAVAYLDKSIGEVKDKLH